MFVGGYISAAGLGLTCPEWPLCPNGVMPNDEYFLEWIHRTVAATTGLLILATTIGVWINKDAGRKIKFTSAFASALVVTQITLRGSCYRYSIACSLSSNTSWYWNTVICNDITYCIVCI